MLLCGVAALVLAAAPVAPDGVSAAPVAQIAVNTLVSIEIAEPVTTRTGKPGDMFAIRLAAPIKHNGQIIVPAGASGQGQVVDAAKAGLLGKPAKLVLAARYVDWNGRRVALRAFRWAQTGEDASDVVMVGSLVPYAGVLSIFIHGGEIDVPAGATALAKLAAPIDLPPSPPAPGPQPEPAL